MVLLSRRRSGGGWTSNNNNKWAYININSYLPFINNKIVTHENICKVIENMSAVPWPVAPYTSRWVQFPGLSPPTPAGECSFYYYYYY